MRLYALVEAGDPEAIDVYLCEQDAQRALEDCLRDEPDWRGRLEVTEVESRNTNHKVRYDALELVLQPEFRPKPKDLPTRLLAREASELRQTEFVSVGPVSMCAGQAAE
jgi:hypothetical protein